MSQVVKPEVGEFYVKRINYWGNPVLFSTRNKSSAIEFAIGVAKKFSDEIIVYKCNSIIDDEVWSSKN